MDFDELFANVCEALQREQRISYRALRRRFELSDDDLEDLKIEMIKAKRLAIDEDGEILVWTGDTASVQLPLPASPAPEPTTPQIPEQDREPVSYTPPHLAEKILTSRSAIEGERKQVTVLFCDLRNSTAIAEQIGPENMHTLLNRFFELALEEVHRYEGTINQFLGDGFMALYGAPIAHEDHGRRGVLAALALQRTLKETDLGKPCDVECKFRMGLNSGLVVVGKIGDSLRMDYSAIGDTTNLAARLQTQADPGEIFVSETTARLIEGYIRLEALEPVEVKGKTEPVSIYKVVGTLPRRSPIVSRSERTLSQFVGRERELATLDELFQQVESGQGQVVGVVADAGQGKSRLLYEFRQRLTGKQVTYLEGRCLSYGLTIPYHPIIDVLRNNCDITETDHPETISEKVRNALQEVGMEAEEFAPYLLQLLGVKEGTESIAQLTSEAIRTRTFETLRQMSLKGSQRQPIIVEIEDSHWLDNTSQDYLASLVESLAGASIMLLTTYRPGYQPSWLGKSYATQISLRSLTPKDGLAVVHSALHGETLPAQVEQMIIQKAEGNPFFVEELTRAVIEHGDTETDIDVPDTIQGVLSARIDRLPESHKHLLQTASVLGREFSPRLLNEIWEGSGALESLLLELKRLEFLYERTGAEEPIYVFKHALTQDVAYESLLTTYRQAFHAAAGQALEMLYADRLEDAYDRLAYHYSHTDNAVKAVEYLTRVAAKAADGYAHAEAITMLQEALVHAERLPEEQRDRCVLDLAIRQAESLFWSGQRQAIVDLYLRCQERLEGLQDPPLTGRYNMLLGRTYGFLGQRELALESLQRALTEAMQCGDLGLMGQAHVHLAQEMAFSGSHQQAIAHAQQAVSLLEGAEVQHRPGVGLGDAWYQLGLRYGATGACHRAVEAATRAYAIGEMNGNRRLQTNALLVIGQSHTMQGECEVSIEALQQALSISPSAFESAFVLGHLGLAYLEQGNVSEALPILEQAVVEACQYRSRQVQCQFQRHLSQAYLMSNDIEKSCVLAQQVFALAQDIKSPQNIGGAQRLLGRIAHTSGNLQEAEHCLQAALTVFETSQVQYELARNHLDLASLAYTQGDHDTATTHLSTAYAWFKKLQVPKWAERTEQLAQEYGVTLAEVEIEDFETEGSS